MDAILAVAGIIGVTNGLFLSIYILLSRFKNNTPDKYLALLVFFLSVRMGKSIISSITPASFIIIHIGLAAFVCVGPGLFLYLKKSADSQKNFSKLNLLHFIPGIIVLLCTFLPYPQNHPVWDFRYNLIMLHLLIYILISFVFFHNKIAISQKADSKGNNLFLIISVLLIWISYAATWFFNILPYLSGAFLFCFVVYIMFFLWHGKKQSQEKYKNSILSKEESGIHFEKLVVIMKESKPYLDNKISLAKLAVHLDITPHVLSQVINENLGGNFFEFINSYRIEEVKKRLAQEEYLNLTIAAVAYDCGFNSISSFNTAFKKSVGQSPGSYRTKFVK